MTTSEPDTLARTSRARADGAFWPATWTEPRTARVSTPLILPVAPRKAQTGAAGGGGWAGRGTGMQAFPAASGAAWSTHPVDRTGSGEEPQGAFLRYVLPRADTGFAAGVSQVGVMPRPFPGPHSVPASQSL